jgi:iron complex outermembrane recepter protein
MQISQPAPRQPAISAASTHKGENMPQPRRTRIAVLIAALAGGGFASAQTTPGPEQTLPEVKVKAAPESPYGPVGGYSATRSATATKTDTPLLETPQAISVVTRERMEDQGATSLQDALNYVAGVRSDAYGLDSRSDNVRVRGSYPVEYRDGVRRQIGGYYTSITRVEPYSLERIEVLRGPSAMLYGQGTTAGVINMVSKRPLAEAQGEVGLQLGNFDRRQVQADMTGPLGKEGEWLYRLVAVGRNSDTQVDFVPDDRSLIAPSLTWRPSGATSLTFQFLWQDDKSGSTSQFFPWSGMVLPNPNGQIPTNRFIGQPGLDRYDSERMEAGWLFEHRFNDRWTVRQNLRYTHNEVDYFTVYADSFTNPSAPFIDADQRVMNRIPYFEERKTNALVADQHLEGRLSTGAVRHQVLAGLEYSQQRETSQSACVDPAAPGCAIAPIDIFSPVYPAFTPPPLAPDPGNSQRTGGVYLQDQMKISERWIVVAGLRYDRSVNKLEGASDEKDHETTKRAGLMYLFDGGWAPYLSYSESFTPVAGTDINNQRFKPLRGEQEEVGLKWAPPGRKFMATAAAYKLKEKNQLTNDPANPLNQIQVDSTTNKGVELELVGVLPPLPQLEIAAHYNYTDLDPQLEAVSEHQAAIWGTYRFKIGDRPGFRAGMGVRYFSSYMDGDGPTTPAWTLLDAMIGYSDRHWRYALNVQNLTDKTYVAACLARGDCWYGARRTVVATAAYRF